MEERKFENQNLNQANDLFQEYIDSLPEENAEEIKEPEEEKKTVFSGVSDRVEQDLLDYKRRNMESSFDRFTSSRFERRRRRRSGNAAVPLIIAGTAGAIILASIGVIAVTRSTFDHSYTEAYPEYYEEEYVDPYETEFAKMSGSLSQPEIFLNGKYVSLPVSMKDFMQEEWKVRTSAFSEGADTVGSDPVSFHIETEWGEEIAEVSVVSPSGEPVPVSEGIVVGLYTDNPNYWYELNGGIYVGSSTWTVEEALKEEGLEWVKRGNELGSRYIIEAPAENEYGYDEYVLRLELEDDYVEKITMQLSQSQSELPAEGN